MATKTKKKPVRTSPVKKAEVKKTEVKKVEPLPEVLSLGNMQHIMQFSKTLADFIKKNGLSTEIKKGQKQYVLVDGWKFAGINFGIVPIPEKPTKVATGQLHIFYVQKKGQYGMYDAIAHVTSNNEEYEKLIAKKDANWSKVTTTDEYKYECTCVLKRVATGEIVGQGYALCTNAEEIKVTFDEYAVLSMAQTRAIAKAFRNTIGFIITAAGFEATPAEEVQDEKYTKKSAVSDLEVEYPKHGPKVEHALIQCESRADFLAMVQNLTHLHLDPEFQNSAKKIETKHFPKPTHK